MQTAGFKTTPKRQQIFIQRRNAETHPVHVDIAYFFKFRQFSVQPGRHHIKLKIIDAVGDFFDGNFRSSFKRQISGGKNNN